MSFLIYFVIYKIRKACYSYSICEEILYGGIYFGKKA